MGWDNTGPYEIAGKGEADNSSFKEALFTGIRIFKTRQRHKELTINVLKKQSKKI